MRPWHLGPILAVIVALLASAGTADAQASACQASGPAGGSYTATVCVGNPSDGASITGDGQVEASLSVSGSDPGVRRVVFYLDGQYLLTDYEAPYVFALPSARFANGAHRLEVEYLLRDNFTTQRAGVDLTFANGPFAPTVNTNTFTPSTGTAPPPGRPFVTAVVGDGASGEVAAQAVHDLIASWQPNLFLYLGDVYEKGSITEYHNAGDAYFSGLRNITDPTVGNHEYENGVAPGYFDYWDNIAPYYAYTAHGWRFVVINSTTQFGENIPGTAQYDFLKNELHTFGPGCVAVYWHHPVFNIGPEGEATRMDQMWSQMVSSGADVLFTGHDHDYQRWEPMDATGKPNPGGVPEFVVGTGGHGSQSFVRSDPRVMATAMESGALRMELNQQGMAYQFQTSAGTTLDSGSVQCRGTPGDKTVPTTPGAVTATAQHLSQAVDLTWTGSQDNVGVTGYDVYRNGSLLAHLGPQTSYSDSAVAPGLTYTYTVQARDAAGNVSAAGAPGSATTDNLAVLFYSGFETGDLSQWSGSVGLTAQQQEVFLGAWGVRGTSTDTTGRANYAYRTFAPANELYAQTRFKFISQGATSVNLLAFKTATGGKLATLYRTGTGKLGLRDEVTAVSTTSSVSASTGAWHTLQLRLRVNGTSSTTEVWLDGLRVDQLSGTADYGTTQIGRVEIGDSATTRVYDLALDEVAVDPNPIADASDPQMPSRLSAVATAGLQVDLNWDAGTDDVGVTGYEIYRNGSLLTTTTGTGTTYSDRSVSPNQSYFYEVRARDAAGNESQPTDIETVATPSVLEDDFESGTLVNWTTFSGLQPDQTQHYSGSWGARATGAGTAAYAAYTLPAAQPRIYYRVRVKRLSQGAATDNLLRYKQASNSALASLTVSSTGKLGMRNDVAATSRTSNADISDGRWHEIQVGVDTVGGRTEVFLDGAPVAALTGADAYGPARIGRLELGESVTGRTFDFAYDDVVVGTDPIPDTDPPSAPSELTATATAGDRVVLDWTAATDNVGVTQYTILRDGSFLAEIGPGTSYVDDTTAGDTTYTYTVTASDDAENESLPSNDATVTTPAEDHDAPTAPQDLVARVYSPTSVELSWTASTDDTAVAGYEVLRDGAVLSTVTSGTTYRDTSVSAGATYGYTVRAFDAGGNRSAPTAPVRAHVSLFGDDFESGALAPHWTNVTGLTVGQDQVEHGAWAARATSSGAATWAYGPLGHATSDPVVTVDFTVASAASQVYLVKLRTAANGSLLGIYRNNDATGTLRLRNDVAGTTATSTTPVSLGVWHRLQLRAHVDATASAGQTEVWLDGTRVAALSGPANLGTTAVGKLQLGDNSTGRSYDVAFDDVSVDEPARIVVRNQAAPSGTGQAFGFSGDAPLGTFSLADGDQRSVTVTDGTYTVSEGADPSGWRLAGLDCTDPDGATTTSGRTATIRATAGETITCTYRNEQLGHIEIGLATDPADTGSPPEQFAFTGDDPLGGFSLSDGGRSFVTVPAGDYTVTQDQLAGYDVTDVRCDDEDSANPSSTSVADRRATVSVEPGESVSCVFTDSRPGRLRILERADSSSGITFPYSSADLPALAGTTLANGQDWSLSVDPGTYRVDAGAVPGWQVGSVTCDDGDSAGDPAARSATFHIQAAEQVTCTFQHELVPGHVIIEERTQPSDTATPKDQFAFTGDAPLGSFTLGDADTKPVDVTAGDYTVVRTARDGYTLTGISCDDAASARPSTTSLAGLSATLKVEPGETVRCVFTDSKQGELVVREQATPSLGVAFPFSSPDVSGLTGTSLQDGQQRAFTVPAGAYSVTVGAVFGWGVQAISCDDAGQADPADRSVANVAAGSATFRIQPGEHVTCTFQHKEHARVTIAEVTDPTTLTDTFRFTSTDLTALNGVILGNGQTRSVSVPAGTYHVTQVATGKLTALKCSDAGQKNAADRSTVDMAKRTATMRVQEGELLTCTWTDKHA